MIIKKLAGQTFIYGLSTIIPKVINYVLAPYLTYTISKVDFGVMSYFYAIIPFVFATLLLGMESAFFRFVEKGDSKSHKQNLFNTLWSATLLLSALFFSVILLFENKIYSLFDSDFPPSLIWIVALVIIVDVVVAIPFARLREEGKPLRFSIIKSTSVIVNVLLAVFFYSVLPDVKDDTMFSWMWIDNFGCGYVFVANLVGSFVSFLMIIPTLRGARFKIDRPLLKKVLVFSIPLYIGGFAGLSNDLFDRFFIEGLLPKDIKWAELGIYTATLKITALMVIFTQMYRYAAEPMFLAKLKKEDFRAGNAEAMTFFVLVSILIFLGVTLYLGIFQYIVDEKYRGGMSLVPIMLINGALMGIFLNLNFWYKVVEKTYFAIIITVSGLIVSVAFNIWLIPMLGIKGAALAKLVSTFFMVALSFYFNQKYYPVPYRIGRIAEYVLLAAVIFFIQKYMNIENPFIDYGIRTAMLLIFIVYAIKREKILLLIKRN